LKVRVGLPNRAGSYRSPLSRSSDKVMNKHNLSYNKESRSFFPGERVEYKKRGRLPGTFNPDKMPKLRPYTADDRLDRTLDLIAVAVRAWEQKNRVSDTPFA
jgi:hypothetical protein